MNSTAVESPTMKHANPARMQENACSRNNVSGVYIYHQPQEMTLVIRGQQGYMPVSEKAMPALQTCFYAGQLFRYVVYHVGSATGKPDDHLLDNQNDMLSSVTDAIMYVDTSSDEHMVRTGQVHVRSMYVLV